MSDDASFGTSDLTYFYLGTLPIPQFIKVYTHQLSHYTLSSLSLLPFTKQKNSSGFSYPDPTLSLCVFPFPFPLWKDSKETSQPLTYVKLINTLVYSYTVC